MRPAATAQCDVLDEDGNIVFYGPGSCYSYYDNSLNQLPEHVFVAKRGFYYGWMDTNGKWLFTAKASSLPLTPTMKWATDPIGGTPYEKC